MEVEDDGPGFGFAVVVVCGHVDGVEAVLRAGGDVVVCSGATVA